MKKITNQEIENIVKNIDVDMNMGPYIEQANFEKLFSINVNDKTEKKGNLTYLSWAWAWAEFCKVYPKATYKVVKDINNNCIFGNKEIGYMVYTEVNNGDGITHEMWLPVMDFKNQAMKTPTTFDINKTLMRCLTKNLAMFGLGLYIYAGEDLPEEELIKKGVEESEKRITEFKRLYDLKEEIKAREIYVKMNEIEKNIIKEYIDSKKLLNK